MLLLVEVQSIAFLKESAFTKYLFIYFLPANRSVQLWVKHKLAIEGHGKNTKCMHASMVLNFELTIIHLSIYTLAVLVFL